MTSLKFEDNIKEKMEKREISPSENSWKRLSDMLDKQETKKSKLKPVIYSIAAAIVGILIFSAFLLIKNKKTATDSLLVIEDKTTNNEFHKEPLENENSILIPEKTKITSNKEVISDKKLPKKVNSDIPKKNSVSFQSKKENLVIVNTTNRKNSTHTIAEKQKETIVDSTLINTNIATILDKIEAIEKNNNEVSDAEIDSLLRNAQRNIISDLVIDENTTTISASLLLQDVEAELDLSFKEKVFNALLTKLKEARTAVAGLDNADKSK